MSPFLTPRLSKRPFLLEILGVLLAGAGALAVWIALSAFFKSVPWTREIWAETLSGFAALAVAFAIWTDRTWGRPAILGLMVLAVVLQGWAGSQEWAGWGRIASLIGSLLFLVVLCVYLYLWPSATHYYERLRTAS